MNRRLLFGLLAVSVFVLGAYGSQIVTRQAVTRTVAMAEPEPLPVAPPIPLVPVEVQNFPVDDEGNLRVSEQGNNETPRRVEVSNVPLPVATPIRTPAQGHLHFVDSLILAIPPGTVLTDVRLSNLPNRVDFHIADDQGPYFDESNVAEENFNLQSGILSDGSLAITIDCTRAASCTGTVMWSGYLQ